MKALPLCLFLAFGCASSTGVWREASTPHFVVRTDLDADIARRAAAMMELNRDMLVSAAWPRTEIPEWARTEVYVLDASAYQRTFGEHVDSLSLGAAPQQFYFYGDPGRWETRTNLLLPAVSTLRYHLAQRIEQSIYPDAPRWYLDGLSKFLETVHLSEDGKSVILGAVNVSELKNYVQHRAVTLSQLLAWKNGPEPNWGLQGMSWIFVHWLSNTQPEPFSRYRGELMRGMGAQAAFDSAFSGLELQATDEALYQYSKHGEYREVAAPLIQTPGGVSERLLTPSDLHVVQARLANAAWRSNPGKGSEKLVRSQVREQIDMALALDPTNVSALVEDDWSPLPQRLTRARAATAAHPGDAAAWELLADLLDGTEFGTDEHENASRKAAALAPGNPKVVAGLAWVLQARGRWSQAMPLVLKAIKQAPNSPAVLETYAAVMFKAGSCTNALAAQERALGRLTAAFRKENSGPENRLAEYRAGCAQRRPRH